MSEPLRLQKILAERGVASSRRKAEELIESGRVTVNGRVADLGDKADPEADEIKIGRKRLPAPARPQVYLMHKPRGLVCTNADPNAERTVFDILPRDLQQQRLVCAGRLDKDSEGMLILTNDGDLVQALTHPSAEIQKRYRVRLSRELDPELIPKLLEGRKLEGDFLKFDKVIPAPSGSPEAGRNCEVHLHHGKKREIRRLFESFGIYVKRLRRIQIGGLYMKNLGPGMFRKLTDREIPQLLRG